jgi:hypothetical protein
MVNSFEDKIDCHPELQEIIDYVSYVEDTDHFNIVIPMDKFIAFGKDEEHLVDDTDMYLIGLSHHDNLANSIRFLKALPQGKVREFTLNCSKLIAESFDCNFYYLEFTL